ncbi:MAG: hypothetical protein M1817_003187 [Caeruleum heppii]|nr:MAG: hypothetical protein M1817_003187 [Caeruleum heppii]
MGICSSCLGHSRRQGQTDTSETSRLLYDDPHQLQYGGINGGPVQGQLQIDPQDIQREEAALQKILAQTTESLVDVFALHPSTQDPSTSTAYSTAADLKIERYQRLLQQISMSDLTSPSAPPEPDSGGTQSDSAHATSDADVLPMSTHAIKHDQVGDLVGGFAELQPGKNQSKGSQR